MYFWRQKFSNLPAMLSFTDSLTFLTTCNDVTSGCIKNFAIGTIQYIESRGVLKTLLKMSYRLKVVDYFRIKLPSCMYDMVLNKTLDFL